MIEIQRIFNPLIHLKQKSMLLLGPRQTGKSWLIRNLMKDVKVYNLLDQKTFRELSFAPEKIRQEIDKNQDKIIVIDEIQKLPELLSEVHLMIEEYGIKFLLTGSSARKIRRNHAHTLGGRVRSRYLHPFISSELKEKFELNRALNFGLIPSIYFSDSPQEDLQSYIGEYLQEEIAAEARVRNIPAFSRFLEVAAQCHTEIINFTKVSNDAQVPLSTVQEYFKVLEDTLIATLLPAFQETTKRKPTKTSKLFFFDNGVVSALQKRNKIIPKTNEYGTFFESYIFHELKTFLDYHAIYNLHYWRSKSQYEVDFIINNKTAIEVKAKENINHRDLKGLKALREENIIENFIVVCLCDQKRTIDDIEILPWKVFLENLWKHELV